MSANDGPDSAAPARVRPAWFEWAVSQPVTEHAVDVEGCSIHYLRWPVKTSTAISGGRSRPGLIFVHGGGAHARWWQFIAPYFTRGFDVVAIDLSGMGESGYREAYSSDQRAREVRAVLRAAGHHSGAYVVGHSLGGFIGMRFGATYGQEIEGVVIVDSPIRRPEASELAPPPYIGQHKVYPSLDYAIGRFRVLPSQPCANSYVLDFIACHSLRAVKGGWQWKFDPKAMGPQSFGQSYREQLGQLSCRSALMYGEESALVDDDTASYMSGLMGAQAPIIAIPDAHHHVMLDQPLAFVAGLRAVLDLWRRIPSTEAVT